jgi:hypothetical protein
VAISDDLIRDNTMKSKSAEGGKLAKEVSKISRLTVGKTVGK